MIMIKLVLSLYYVLFLLLFYMISFFIITSIVFVIITFTIFVIFIARHFCRLHPYHVLTLILTHYLNKPNSQTHRYGFTKLTTVHCLPVYPRVSWKLSQQPLYHLRALEFWRASVSNNYTNTHSHNSSMHLPAIRLIGPHTSACCT
jgi:hypothetical protein